MERWEQLLKLLGVYRDKLERYCTIITLQRDRDLVSDHHGAAVGAGHN